MTDLLRRALPILGLLVVAACDPEPVPDEAAKAAPAARAEPVAKAEPQYELPKEQREAVEQKTREKLEQVGSIELVPRGETKLPDWAVALEKKCDGGDVESCVELASVLHDGGGEVSQDWGRAGELLMKACRKGSARGCDLLGALAVVDGMADKAAIAGVLDEACKAKVKTACDAGKTLAPAK